MKNQVQGDAGDRGRERRFFEHVVRYRLGIIVAVAVLTAAFAAQLPRLEIDPDTEAFIPKGHPVRTFWSEAKERFDVGKDIFVAVEADGPEGIFTPEILRGITELTAEIEALHTVMTGDVRSISNSDAVVGTEEGITVEPFFEEPPATAEEAARVRASVFANEVYLDRLVSRDGSIAVILVQAHDAYDADTPYPHPVDVFEEVASLVESRPIPGTRMLIAGTTAVESVFGRQMAQDLARLIPLALAVVIVVLFFCFRSGSVAGLLGRSLLSFAVLAAFSSWRTGSVDYLVLAPAAVVTAMLTVRGVLLPALVVVIAVIWTWGTQAVLGLPIYIAGTMVPPLLLAIGCADGIHIMERYFEKASSSNSRNDAVISALMELWRPVLLTSLTTAAGFGSLTLTRMTVYQVFGLTTALGILVAMAMSLTLLPALLALLPLPARGASGIRVTAASRALMSVGATVSRHRVSVMAAGATAAVALLVAARGLNVDYSWVESLEPGTPVLEADRLLRTRHGGAMPLNVVVRSPEPGGIQDPDLLRGIDEALAEIGAHPKVGDTRSIAEYIKRMNQAMNEDRPEELRIPDSRNLVAQYLLLYTMSGDASELDDMLDYDYQSAQLGILLRSDWLRDMNEVFELAENALDRHVRSLGATATITGSAMITKTVFDEILDSQVSSLATATVLVLVFLTLLFRSVTDAAMCMVPSLFTAVANFGGMALVGLPLGPMEAMVSAIALGIGIDYSIHLMSGLRETIKGDVAPEAAIVEVMRTTGRAILFNGMVVVAGFTVLAFSRSPSNASFGIQIAVNMALCCAAALVLLPAVLVAADRR